MLLSAKDTFCGVPVLTVRHILARIHNERSWEWACDGLLDEEEAQGRLFDGLVQGGWMQVVRRIEGIGVDLTPQGVRWACASARPVKRATARKLVQQIKDRAADINACDVYCYRISALVVFGSYINSDKDILGDLDIGYSLEARHTDIEKQRALKEIRRRYLARLGWSYRHYSAYLSLPETEITRLLKARSAALSLHLLSIDGGVVARDKYEVIFGSWTPEPEESGLRVI